MACLGYVGVESVQSCLLLNHLAVANYFICAYVVTVDLASTYSGLHLHCPVISSNTALFP